MSPAQPTPEPGVEEGAVSIDLYSGWHINRPPLGIGGDGNYKENDTKQGTQNDNKNCTTNYSKNYTKHDTKNETKNDTKN